MKAYSDNGLALIGNAAPGVSGGQQCGCGATQACRCGGAGVQAPVFVRPRFFAGQLLTEDDLQLLTSYVTGKDRLRNRYLFGDGVVCGLEVSCHPCGGGAVIVRPGYALDCCGNDLVVPCPVELDVNALVQDLRIRSLAGYDCGDPCFASRTGANAPAMTNGEPKANGRNGPNAEARPAAQGAGAGQDRGNIEANLGPGTGQGQGGANGEERPREGRHYCLFLQYTEEQADPVAPYPTGESCDLAVCEPTRVREGFRFVLRAGSGKGNTCADPCGPDSGNLLSAIRRCVGDLGDLMAVAAVARLFQRYAVPMRVAIRSLGTTPTLDQSVAARHSRDLEVLEQLVGKRQDGGNGPGVVGAPEVAGAPEVGNGSSGPTASLEMVERLRGLASANVSLQLAALQGGPATPEAGVAAPQGVAVSEAGLAPSQGGQAPDVSRVVADACRILRPELRSLFPDPRERELAADLLDEATRWTAPGMVVANLRGSVEPWMLAQGLPYGAGIQAAMSRDLPRLREWLLDRLDGATNLTDCRLRRDVTSIRIPVPGADPANQGMVEAGEQLDRALLRYVTDCVCSAVNPPCPTCEDPAVLLACLEVDDCEVVGICNAVRSFVPTGLSLQYWVPQLRSLGDLVERFCCEGPPCPTDSPSMRRSAEGTERPSPTLQYEPSLVEPEPGPQAARFARAFLEPLRIQPDETRAIVRAGTDLGRLARDLGVRLDLPGALFGIGAMPSLSESPTPTAAASASIAPTADAPAAAAPTTVVPAGDAPPSATPTEAPSVDALLDDPRLSERMKAEAQTALAAQLAQVSERMRSEAQTALAAQVADVAQVTQMVDRMSRAAEERAGETSQEVGALHRLVEKLTEELSALRQRFSDDRSDDEPNAQEDNDEPTMQAGDPAHRRSLTRRRQRPEPPSSGRE